MSVARGACPIATTIHYTEGERGELAIMTLKLGVVWNNIRSDVVTSSGTTGCYHLSPKWLTYLEFEPLIV